jgi:phage-related tail fiber protein
MANIDDAFRIESLSLNDNILITEGSLDPSTSGGYEAPIGSIYINNVVGNMYHKIGPSVTDWIRYGDAQTVNPLDIFAASKSPTGHVNRTDSIISFNDSTRTFSVSPLSTATSFVYYIKGVIHTISTTKTITLPDITGEYIVYFDGTDTLQHSPTITTAILSDNAVTASIYWNATQGVAVYVADERHSTVMDGATHSYLHTVIGSKYVSGLSFGGTLNPGGTTNADVEISVTNGQIRDEDLIHNIVETGQQTTTYDLQQSLTPIAQVPVYYRLGSGDWYIKTADNFPIIYHGTAGYTGTLPPVNIWNGIAWTLTELSSNHYGFVHLLATNDIRHPMIALQGIVDYTTIPSGHDEALAELSQLKGLPFQEFVPITSLIFQATTTANTPNMTYAKPADGSNFVDWRFPTQQFGNLSISVPGVSDHGNLTGLTDDDHHQYALAGANSTRTFNVGDLMNVADISHAPVDNGSEYGLKWNSALAKYDISSLTLSGLSDVAVTEGSAIDGWTVSFNNTSSKWIASPVGDILPLTTKGDILTHDASSYIRLPVGTNNYVLTADSATPAGISWKLSTDQYLKNSATDTTPGYLTGKLSVSSNLVMSTVNPNASEVTNIDLSNTGVAANTYTKVVVDVKGRITSATTPTTLAGYSITDTYTMTQVDNHTWNWSVITNKPTTLAGYGITDAVQTNAAITPATHTSITYDAKGLVTGGTNPTTLAGYGITDAVQTNAVITPGTFRSVSFDAKGLVLSGTNPTTLSGYGITDAVQANVGVTSATHTSITYDAKGLVTGGTNPTTLAGYGITDAVPLSQKGAASGVATLDATGKLSANQLPSIAITDTFVVASQVLMLTLTAHTGDIAVRSDTSQTFILQGSDPTVLSNWVVMLNPTGGVTSVTTAAPTEGLTITGGPIVSTGTLTFTLANDLAAVESLTTYGIAVRTGTSAWTTRTLVAPAAGISITDAAGITGNPTLSLTNDLGAIEALNTNGMLARTSTDTWASRAITATANQTTVANGDGISGNPTIGIAPNPIIPGNVSLTLPAGPTSSQPSSPTAAMVRFNTTSKRGELYNGDVWSNIGTGDGTVTSITATGSTGLTVGGGPITSNGTLSFTLGIELQGVSMLGANGIVSRTGAGTYATRTLLGTSGNITITSGDGSNNPAINLATVGAAGTYSRVTTDAYGRVTSGTTDAISNLSDVNLTSPALGNVLKYDGSKWVNSVSSPSSASGVLSTWILAAGVRYYADFAHNLGTNDVVISLFNNTNNSIVYADSIVETSVNNIRVTVVGNTVPVRIVVIANGLVVPSANPLPNVVNSLQVINAGGSPSIQQDTIANIPLAGTTGRLFLSTDTKILFRDNGTSWDILSSSQGVIRTLTFFANSLDSPVNSDFVINALAPTISDPTTPAVSVRSFSNTTEQGVGFMITPPLGATVVTFKTKGRAGTAPASSAVVQPRVYIRGLPTNAAVGAWSTAVDFTALSIPTNAFYQYNSNAFTLAALGLSVGTLYQFELTRKVTGVTGGTNLAYPWYLVDLTVEFT